MKSQQNRIELVTRLDDDQIELSSSPQETTESCESSAEPKSAETEVECTYDDTSIQREGRNWVQTSLEVQPFKKLDPYGNENKDLLPYREALPTVVTHAQRSEISVPSNI